MDPLTHALLGAATAQAFFTKTLKRKATWIGLLAGSSPDLDIFIRSGTDPLLSLIYHRQFTHALVFIPIGGFIIAVLLFLLFKELRTQAKFVIFASIVAYSTHGFLDALTSYGTQLFWPFSDVRISWDVISIIDPVFTLVLLIGVIWTAISEKAKPVILALLFTLIYLGFAYWQHGQVVDRQEQLAESRQHVIEKYRAMPTLGNVFVWRTLYLHNNTIYADNIVAPLFKKPYVEEGSKMLLYKAKSGRAFEVFSWFSDGYVSAFSQKPLIIIDARYLTSYKPLVAMWGIELPEVKWRRQIQSE